MIVDDNVFNLQTMQTMIKLKFKIDTVAVCGGQEAIDEVQKKINSGS
jgi:CheY-like chemotaxis protein